MSEPFIAQITLFAGNFAPSGWAFCSGQVLPVSQNTALFSLLGTTYGGDGEVTFALPDLRGRYPRGSHNSTGPGLSTVPLGQRSGSETHVAVPAHSHGLGNNAIEDSQNQNSPAGTFLAEAAIYRAGTPDARMGPATTESAGASSVNHLDPYLGLNYIIALVGIFPS